MRSREPLEQVDSATRGRNLKVGRSRKQSKQAKLEKPFRDGWRKFKQHRWKGESASSGPSSSGRGELDSGRLKETVTDLVRQALAADPPPKYSTQWQMQWNRWQGGRRYPLPG